MTDENNENQEKELMLKIPYWVIVSIVLDAEARGVSVLRDTLDALNSKWVIIAKDEEGKYFVQGYVEYDDCASQVAHYHGTEYQVQYVLKNGFPRKNVRVEVKARL